MTKEFYSLEALQKYYDEKTNTYVFKEDGVYINLVIFNFNLDINANIDAYDITAFDIKAWDINVFDIKARDIKARDIEAYYIKARNIKAYDIKAYGIKARNINYYAVCCAYENITCKSIKGRRENAKYFVLDGKFEVLENDK